MAYPSLTDSPTPVANTRNSDTVSLMSTETINCPDCLMTFAPQFAKLAEQHAAEHARIASRAAERAAADAAIRAAHGRPRGTKYAQAEMFTYSLGTPVVQAELF